MLWVMEKSTLIFIILPSVVFDTDEDNVIVLRCTLASEQEALVQNEVTFTLC
jgi:hypothetical protein